MLPQLRSRPTFAECFWRRSSRRQELAQLVHDLPVSILEPEFGDHDFWFLNVHARSFLQRCTGDAMIRGKIAALFRLVPEDLRDKLEWQGPSHQQ